MEFVLRAWRREDIPTVARYANNPRVAENLRDIFPFPYTEADAAAYILNCIKAEEKLTLRRAVDIGGEAVGSITVTPGDDVYRKSAEVGYWLAEPFWGQGIMSEAIRRISEEAFCRMDIVRLYAEPFARNTGSRRALEKAGFVLEGILRSSVYKNGQILDSCLYARLRDPDQNTEPAK